jgi:hypothetical protein
VLQGSGVSAWMLVTEGVENCTLRAGNCCRKEGGGGVRKEIAANVSRSLFVVAGAQSFELAPRGSCLGSAD